MTGTTGYNSNTTMSAGSGRIADSFLWGVATSGYQSEGGYNGTGQPQNNWAHSELKGSVMRTGSASEFWTRYAEDFRVCQELGLNAFRLGLEWARIQPSTSIHPVPAPAFDWAVLDAYADRLAACRQHGLEPVVTLHHFTHPAWLGLDAWLLPETVDLYVEYVQVAVAHLNRRLAHHHQLPPVRWYITINEPNILVSNTYLSRQFPAGSFKGMGSVLQAYNHLLAAHVRAYNCIHDLYEQEGWETPNVSINTYCSDLYWSDKVIWDFLNLREQGVKRGDLSEHIYSKARELEGQLLAASLPFRHDLPYRLGRIVRRFANWFGHRHFDLKAFDFYLKTLEASPRDRVFDFVGIDYYDPFLAHAFRLPSFSDFEFETHDLRSWLISGITSKWWDWRSLPEGLHFFSRYYSQDLDDRAVLIAENGMALRRKADNSVSSHRSDQLHRSKFIEAHVRQVMRLRAEGVPMAGYLHWSLTDNYEWGTYTPRFGLLTIDFAHGSERLIEDHLGDRPAETYARLIREARAELQPEVRLEREIAL